jgi:hypothetical protein
MYGRHLRSLQLVFQGSARPRCWREPSPLRSHYITLIHRRVGSRIYDAKRNRPLMDPRVCCRNRLSPFRTLMPYSLGCEPIHLRIVIKETPPKRRYSGSVRIVAHSETGCPVAARMSKGKSYGLASVFDCALDAADTVDDRGAFVQFQNPPVDSDDLVPVLLQARFRRILRKARTAGRRRPAGIIGLAPMGIVDDSIL